MRKLLLQVQVTLDGYMAGSQNEMDWMVWDWDQELKKDVQLITKDVSTILLGRKLAEGFIDYWKQVSTDDANPDKASGIEFTNMEKVVFSTTLVESRWEKTSVVNTNAKEYIKLLKNENGKNMIVYGGVDFVNYLIKENVIDVLHLFINPTALGEGRSLFTNRNSYKITNSKLYKCGIQGLVLEKSE